MNLYYVEHRATLEGHTVAAESAQQACEKLGWLMGDCYVKERGPMPKPQSPLYGVSGGPFGANHR